MCEHLGQLTRLITPGLALDAGFGVRDGVGSSRVDFGWCLEPSMPILGDLVNALVAGNEDIILVLDDYHLVDTAELINPPREPPEVSAGR